MGRESLRRIVTFRPPKLSGRECRGYSGRRIDAEIATVVRESLQRWQIIGVKYLSAKDVEFLWQLLPYVALAVE